MAPPVDGGAWSGLDRHRRWKAGEIGQPEMLVLWRSDPPSESVALGRALLNVAVCHLPRL